MTAGVVFECLMNARMFLLSLFSTVASAAGDSCLSERAAEAKPAKGDKALAEAIAQWKKAEPKTPEPLIAEANRVFDKARLPGIRIDPVEPEKGDFELTDPETGETAGRIKF